MPHGLPVPGRAMVTCRMLIDERVLDKFYPAVFTYETHWKICCLYSNGISRKKRLETMPVTQNLQIRHMGPLCPRHIAWQVAGRTSERPDFNLRVAVCPARRSEIGSDGTVICRDRPLLGIPQARTCRDSDSDDTNLESFRRP